MKTGMNLLLWTTEVSAEHDPLLDQIKADWFRRRRGPGLRPRGPGPVRAAGQADPGARVRGDRRDGDEARGEPDLVGPGDPQGGGRLSRQGPRPLRGLRLRDPLRPDPLGDRPLLGAGADRGRIQARRRDDAAGRRDRREAGIRLASSTSTASRSISSRPPPTRPGSSARSTIRRAG